MSTTVLELHAVGRTYPGHPPVAALIDATMTVNAGELLAVIGASGSGKSTLLHLAGTLERPSSGCVVLAGHDTSTLTDAELSALRATKLGFVFQHFALLEHLTALENVATGLLYRGVGRPRRRMLAAEALARVGISHRAHHRPATMSGGERQRVAIARAIVGEPVLVLADEPTGNLDSAAGAVVMDLLVDLNRDGSAIVVVTHDPQVAAIAARHIVVQDGHIREDRK